MADRVAAIQLNRALHPKRNLHHLDGPHLRAMTMEGAGGRGFNPHASTGHCSLRSQSASFRKLSSLANES
jgi:hypothetical protein